MEFVGDKSNASHEFYNDGLHLSATGITMLGPMLQKVADQLGADKVVSDSCLQWRRYDQDIQKYIRQPCQPCWGASFWGGQFRKHLWKFWEESDKRILVLS